MAGAIRLEVVTPTNYEAVSTIDVGADQRAYVDTPSLAEFLAEAPLHATFVPYAALAGDAVVGFVSAGPLPEDSSKWWVPLLIVDRAHQGRGYGRMVMEEVIERAQTASPPALVLGLSYKPENRVAAQLYRSLGFELSGVDEKGEVLAWLHLGAPLADS